MRWVDTFSKGAATEKGVEGEMVLDEGVLQQMSTERIPDERRKGIKWSSPCCLIYTSGCVYCSSVLARASFRRGPERTSVLTPALLPPHSTTGLPKAALTLHGRCATAFQVWTTLNSFGPKTRIYTPMPLYHSTAAILAVGVAWCAHSTVVIGRKFSATTFWRDVRDSRANVVQYVGEGASSLASFSASRFGARRSPAQDGQLTSYVPPPHSPEVPPRAPAEPRGQAARGAPRVRQRVPARCAIPPFSSAAQHVLTRAFSAPLCRCLGALPRALWRSDHLRVLRLV